METMILDAPAKINTYLKVLGKREDGYHELEMVMVPITLHDTIELKLTDRDIELEQAGFCDLGMIDEKNLCYKAASLLKEEGGVDAGVKIFLEKVIPLGAGLGGGSSDAATVLLGLNKLWNLNWGVERLAKLGLRVGADVPFFCFSRPAYVTGIGDKVKPFKTFPKLPILLINPCVHVSTGEVYSGLDLKLTAKPLDASFREIFNGLEDVCSCLLNDLERVALRVCPEIADVRGFLKDNGARGVLMSGSGSTVFGIFEDQSKVDRTVSKVKDGWKAFSVTNYT